MKFEDAIKLIGLAEGGYSNDPTDPGGETICGLSRVKNPDLSIWSTVDAWKCAGSTTPAQLDKLAHNDRYFMESVHAIYRGRYWNTSHCDDLPDLLRYPVLSCAVNCGYKTAIKLLQRAVGVPDDGIFGGVTYNAVRKTPADGICIAFCDKWRQYYRELLKTRPELEKYRNGWMNRIAAVLRDNY